MADRGPSSVAGAVPRIWVGALQDVRTPGDSAGTSAIDQGPVGGRGNADKHRNTQGGIGAQACHSDRTTEGVLDTAHAEAG